MTTSLPTGGLRVAAAQAVAEPGEIERNAATAARLIAQAAERGAGIVVFPELFLCCYDLGLLQREPVRCDVSLDDTRLEPVREACRDANVVAVVGASVLDDDGRTISALVVDGAGDLLARYDKQHLDRSERDLFRPGTDACAVDIHGWRLAIGICYDGTFPEHARAAALAGAHGYLCPVSHTERSVVHPARARENTMYVVLSNHVGEADGRRLCGHSAIWGPNGEVLADAGPTEEGLALADFDPEVLARIRADRPVLEEARVYAAAGAAPPAADRARR
ncbi:MAG TPA: carbon-nitrogen hydrolase family protein [Gaiellaceae bacterium]|nr:carbon-nitrogen hydrolase family protein [Gaiellaceae bacterium]